MTPETNRLLERMRQRREQRAAELTAAASPRVSAGVVPGAAHPSGSRVFDPVTGKEGVIVGGTTENVVVPTARRADR